MKGKGGGEAKGREGERKENEGRVNPPMFTIAVDATAADVAHVESK